MKFSTCVRQKPYPILSVLLTFAPLNSNNCSTFLLPSAAALCRGRQSFQPEESSWAILGRRRREEKEGGGGGERRCEERKGRWGGGGEKKEDKVEEEWRERREKEEGE